ncbi:MAG: TlpA disulfide reductase family protein, partial [Planctomycetota bacterium]
TAKQQDMIGKPAPDLKFDAWANADEFNVDDLKGKVVLFDFWAVWCGPCVRTFPHLRAWRKEYSDNGFEIVGITRYYNYQWNEDAGFAFRSEEKVDPEMERLAVGKFLQSKEVQHPTVFTPTDSTLWEEYGVVGIPHAVLVDRDGIVRLVKVGSDQESTDALNEKIKELIDQ